MSKKPTRKRTPAKSALSVVLKALASEQDLRAAKDEKLRRDIGGLSNTVMVLQERILRLETKATAEAMPPTIAAVTGGAAT